MLFFLYVYRSVCHCVNLLQYGQPASQPKKRYRAVQKHYKSKKTRLQNNCQVEEARARAKRMHRSLQNVGITKNPITETTRATLGTSARLPCCVCAFACLCVSARTSACLSLLGSLSLNICFAPSACLFACVFVSFSLLACRSCWSLKNVDGCMVEKYVRRSATGQPNITTNEDVTENSRVSSLSESPEKNAEAQCLRQAD